jgi:hypothetical protein
MDGSKVATMVSFVEERNKVLEIHYSFLHIVV